MKKLRIGMVILVILVSNGISSAEIYQWVDENGVTHYSDAPVRDEAPVSLESSKRSPAAVRSAEPPAAPTPPAERPAPAPSAKQKERTELMESVSKRLEESGPQEGEVAAPVELYVTDWCPWCKKAERFLENEGVDYVIYNVQRDRKAAERMRSLTRYNGVPFAVINGQHIKGYSAEAYRRALRSRKK